MTACIGGINIALYLYLAFALSKKYRYSKDAGFLWLIVPIVVFPCLAVLITYGKQMAVDRLVAGQPVGVFPFVLVETGRLTLGRLLTRLNFIEHTVWAAFGVTAVLLLRSGSAPRPKS